LGDIFRPDEGVAQFGRNRRLAKDFENLAETLATFVTLASIQPVLRRLARAEVLNSINDRSAIHHGEGSANRL